MYVFTVSQILGTLLTTVVAAFMADCDIFGLFDYYTDDGELNDDELWELHFNFYEISCLYYNVVFSVCYLTISLPTRKKVTLVAALLEICCCYFGMLVFHISFAYGRYSIVLTICASGAGALWASLVLASIIYAKNLYASEYMPE